MKSLTPFDFGQVIAFLIPGFLAFYALTYISPLAFGLFNRSFEKEGGFGVELAIILFSLAAGVVVSALRVMLLDEIQWRTGIQRRELNYASLADEKTRQAFNDAIANTYRFAQFYGNMFISIAGITILRLWSLDCIFELWPVTVVLLVSLIVLFIAHRHQLEDSYTTIGEILSSNSQSSNPDATAQNKGTPSE